MQDNKAHSLPGIVKAATMRRKSRRTGFTIVELLIVIVVIGILAAITIVAYNGVQQRARDAQRKSDIAALIKGLEVYYVDNGKYPTTGYSCGVTSMNGWVTTADEDGCWRGFLNQLKPYANLQTITDPTATTVTSSHDLFYSGKTNYIITTYYCSRQTYEIIYTTEEVVGNGALEGSSGSCSALSNQVSNQAPSTKKHVIVSSKV